MVFELRPFAQNVIPLKRTSLYRPHAASAVDDDTKINKPVAYNAKQLIAGKAFRLLGLHNMPVYKIDTGFMLPRLGAACSAENIQVLAELKRNHTVLQDGLIYQNAVAGYVAELATAGEDENVLAFSKILAGQEAVIVYNTSATEAKEKFVSLQICDQQIKQLNSLYGVDATARFPVYHTHAGEKCLAYIKIYLRPLQFVILKNY